jgi:hypothetical protein
MALERIKMIRKIHRVRIKISTPATGATTTNPVTEDHDISSLGIVDFNKCELVRQMTYTEYMTLELTSATNIRSYVIEPSNEYSADVQIIEHY